MFSKLKRRKSKGGGGGVNGGTEFSWVMRTGGVG